LTEDQRVAVTAINAGLDAGQHEFLLQAPTGSGKTEVMLRVAVDTILAGDGYVVVLAPTRDLIRQHVTYFSDRLEGSGLGVAQIHGGAAPADRRAAEEGVSDGSVRVIIGSAMLLTIDRYWDMLDASDLVFVDDVNAFDEREHLRLLEDLDAPLLFASATPNELRSFLVRVGAFNRVVRMRKMPFNVLPTKIHKVEGVWGEPPPEQLSRADELIREHLARGSRIFVIGRTRGDVPRLAQRLEETYDIDVQQLRGDMADTSEQSKRNRRSGVKVSDIGTRVEMMTAFRGRAPSILAATNLIGSGIDIPAADLIVITDSDAFGESETEQLIGRVGRRERPSDAVLVTGTTFEKNPSRSAGGGRALTFMPRGMRASRFNYGRR
jgi:transcription-repair coupling factor (superfamily II helicase)